MHYHMTDQATCLLTAEGRLAVDFIGRVSTLLCCVLQQLYCGMAWVAWHGMAWQPAFASKPEQGQNHAWLLVGVLPSAHGC